jgi:hypothetical protein
VSLFLFFSKIFDFIPASNWYIWLITLWLFLFILHFIKVYITDRFMNKGRDQIDRLVALQQKKIAELEKHIVENTTKNNKYDYNDCAASKQCAWKKQRAGLASAKRF